MPSVGWWAARIAIRDWVVETHRWAHSRRTRLRRVGVGGSGGDSRQKRKKIGRRRRRRACRTLKNISSALGLSDCGVVPTGYAVSLPVS